MSSGFRKIRPSFGEGSASGHEASEGSTTGARRLQWEKEGAEGASTSTSKRRRVPESVTRNACVNCKKARAKCDGKQPCKRCATRVEASECTYEVHIKHAKEELLKQIKELKAKDHLTEQILQSLSTTDDKVPEILERLKSGEEYDTIVHWLDRAPRVETLSPRGSPRSVNEASDQEMGGVATSRWTTVTADSAVLNHLFQLYFAWVHPVHTLFDEGQFAKSYKDNGGHCSSVLVNAICAMACHLHSADDGNGIDFMRLGDEFLDAVQRDIDPNSTELTTVQAFAVTYLVNCSRGQALLAGTYLRIASNSLPSTPFLDADGSNHARRDTVRGVRNLNIEWAQATFQIPTNVNSSGYNSGSVADNDAGHDASMWYQYRFMTEDLGQHLEGWPSLLATTNREKTRLTEIMQDITAMMYTQQGHLISAKQYLYQYRRLEEWREELPSMISNIDESTGVVPPHVLSLLILHITVTVQLLRPLLDFKGFPASLIEGRIWTFAQEGLGLLDHFYRARYTCRYQPVLQMFGALQLIDTIARYFPGGAGGDSKNGSEAIQFGIEILMESKVGFPLAHTLQELLRRTAKECAIPIPAGLAERMKPPGSQPQTYRLDDFLEACTMPSYVQPVHEVHAKFSPAFSADWMAEAPKYGFRESTTGAVRLRGPSDEERGAQSLMQIRNLLNS